MEKIRLSLVTVIAIDKLNKKTPLEVFNNQLMEAMIKLNSSPPIRYTFINPKKERK